MWAPRADGKTVPISVAASARTSCPRGERYELCRSVHAEANALISASRERMIGASLYLTGVDARTGGYVEKSSCCSMCKRMVINAGIEHVYIRDTKNEYRKVDVEDWIREDESLEGKFGY